MSAFPNTPELRIDRSDSKNAATTCRGITSSGRPCRNAIRAGNNSKVGAYGFSKNLKLRVDDPSDESLYCWQHKDQASISAKSSPGPRQGNTPILEGRDSIETLAERLGLIDIQESPKQRPKIQRHNAGGAIQSRPKKKRPQQQSSGWCCFGLCPAPSDSSHTERPRPKPAPSQAPAKASMPSGIQSNKPEMKQASSYQGGSYGTPTKRNDLEDPFIQSGTGRKKVGGKVATPDKAGRPTPSPAGTPSRAPRPKLSSPGNISRPSSRRPSDAKTLAFMRLVDDVPPETAALLLAELAKPISAQDEPGYIYIFRLEPETLSPALVSDARTSLRPPDELLVPFTPGSRGKQVVASQTQGTYLLKIGRATNIQRRLNEWKRQCEHSISLMRYYPYVSSSDPNATPRKVPHSHKVERLIHIQLTGLNLRVTDREKCKTCGREHREWFEVKADRESVADLDRIVRKWSDWNEAEGHNLV